MRRIKLLFLFGCVLFSWVPSVFAWSIPDISTENLGRYAKWREERGEERRRVMQDKRDERREERRQEAEPNRQEEAGNADRRSLSPEERRELRRQIRRANQDGNR